MQHASWKGLVLNLQGCLVALLTQSGMQFPGHRALACAPRRVLRSDVKDAAGTALTPECLLRDQAQWRERKQLKGGAEQEIQFWVPAEVDKGPKTERKSACSFFPSISSDPPGASGSFRNSHVEYIQVRSVANCSACKEPKPKYKKFRNGCNNETCQATSLAVLKSAPEEF